MNNINNQNQTGAGIALIFAIIGFVISLYKIFSIHSPFQYEPATWWIGLFTLLALILTGSMFTSKTSSAPILAIISSIIAGMLAINLMSYGLLSCMVICLIGCVIQMCYVDDSELKAVTKPKAPAKPKAAAKKKVSAKK